MLIHHSDPGLKAKINSCIPFFDSLPAVVIIHDLADGTVIYLSKTGVKFLNTTLEEIASLPHEEYHRRYFNEEDAKDYAPKLFSMLDSNSDEEMISHFQQVRPAATGKWTWHLSSVKVFHRDETGKPTAAIALAMPIDDMHHMTAKAARLLEENNFLRENAHQFNQLTAREKEVLRLIALGKSAGELASELCISETTAQTHRRNLKNKLGVNSYYELSQYATAFDLI